jgi:glycosyltransferase involved in cell wall biosynthesis
MGDKRLHIVLFWFMDDWGQFGRSYELIAQQLSRRKEVAHVVCVLQPDGPLPIRTRPPLHIHQWKRKLKVVVPRQQILKPDFKPDNVREWVNGRLGDATLKAILKLHGYNRENTLMWLFPPHPYADRLRKMVPHRHLITHVLDNNSLMEDATEELRRTANTQYRQLASQSNQIFVNSALNLEIFSAIHPKVRCFESAVDPAFFDIRRTTSPKRVRIAYLGWVTERTDVALLEQIADANEHWELRLAAPDHQASRERLRALLTRSNVTWIRNLPYRDAPKFLGNADIGIIPHHDTPYSRSMSPLKLFQYLGAGLPVVSTRISGIENWKDHILIASSSEELLQHIRTASTLTDPDSTRCRVAAMRKETWSHRVNAMLKEIISDWNRTGTPS